MLKTDPTSLLEEIQAGEKRRDERLASLDDQIERYHGPWYAGEGPDDDEKVDPENHAYEYVSAFIPQTVHGKPRVKFSTSRPTAQQQVVQGLEVGVNRWISDTRFKETLEELAYDYLFRWSVAVTSVQPRADSKEQSDPVLMPQVQRISPRDAGWDANATHPKRARIMWHKWYIDHEDLLKRAQRDSELPEEEQEGWDIQAVKQLVSGRRVETQGPDESYKVDREEVAVYDVWIKDDFVDEEKQRLDTYNGTIVSIAAFESAEAGGKGSVEVKRRQDYFGPPTGPYQIGGCYLVPDRNEPLSPLVAVQTQSDTLNAYTNTMIEGARSFVRKVFMSGEDQAEAERINAAGHDQVTLLESMGDLTNRISQVTLGGIEPEQFQVAAFLRDTLDRVSGLTDVQRGNISGDGTATEVSYAAEASAARTQHIRGKFVDFAERLLSNVAFFMYHTDQIILPLGEEGLDAVRQGGEVVPEGVEAWFFGGTWEEGDGGSFFDLEMSIDLYSMVRTSESALRRKGEVLTKIMALLVPMMPMTPFVRWAELIKMLGDAENFPELNRLFDWSKLQQSAAVATPMMASQGGKMASAPGFKQQAPAFGFSSSESPGQELAAMLGAQAPQVN